MAYCTYFQLILSRLRLKKMLGEAGCTTSRARAGRVPPLSKRSPAKTEEGNLGGRNASSTLRWHLHLFQDVTSADVHNEWTPTFWKVGPIFQILVFG
jgi:hypothetical protein